ncbi:hypothetical protein [Streptomyces sp. NPDC086023]
MSTWVLAAERAWLTGRDIDLVHRESRVPGAGFVRETYAIGLPGQG